MVPRQTEMTEPSDSRDRVIARDTDTIPAINRDGLESKKENVKGRINEAPGTLMGNKNLESEDANERADSVAQERMGSAFRRAFCLQEVRARRDSGNG